MSLPLYPFVVGKYLDILTFNLYVQLLSKAKLNEMFFLYRQADSIEVYEELNQNWKLFDTEVRKTRFLSILTVSQSNC